MMGVLEYSVAWSVAYDDVNLTFLDDNPLYRRDASMVVARLLRALDSYLVIHMERPMVMTWEKFAQSLRFWVTEVFCLCMKNVQDETVAYLLLLFLLRMIKTWGNYDDGAH
jgi:hypothetical protein